MATLSNKNLKPHSSSDDDEENIGSLKARRSRKVVEKRDGRFGLGYMPSR